MNLNLNCILCNLKQVLTVTDLVQADNAQREIIMREVLLYLHETNYQRTNPEVIKGTWDIVTRHIKNNDPYKEIKAYYNRELMKISAKVYQIIDQSDDKLLAALKIAIAANLIDFVASPTFNEKVLLKKIDAINEQKLAINDSKRLFESLQNANTLLYLGDNCGEIVIDKIFIKYIKKMFPSLKVYFGVRGQPIVNDVTLEDAHLVKMEEVAEVISNGDGSLGTVIEKTSTEFQQVFFNADVIIAKGQGNYESLSEINRGQIFFLFMAKCKAVAGSLGVSNQSIVCAKKAT